MQVDIKPKTFAHFKSGYVAIIGEPNVGKSTLMNSLIGQKISAVTSKPQTTRHKILGILSTEQYQIVFHDTPGLLKPKYLLHEVMLRLAKAALNDADIILFMIDATNPQIDIDSIEAINLRWLNKIKKPVFLLINKIDLIKKQNILPIIAFYSERYPFKEIIPISALNLHKTEDLIKTLVKELPVHSPYYPLGIVSESNERFFVSEIIREKIFEKFRDEVPYSTTVDIVEFKERKKGNDYISAEIYVERNSQKGILIGKQGSALKEIGELARHDIEEFLQHPVYLDLYVKVRSKWRDDATQLKQFGYKT